VNTHVHLTAHAYTQESMHENGSNSVSKACHVHEHLHALHVDGEAEAKEQHHQAPTDHSTNERMLKDCAFLNKNRPLRCRDVSITAQRRAQQLSEEFCAERAREEAHHAG
jgi:hypothetical protein